MNQDYEISQTQWIERLRKTMAAADDFDIPDEHRRTIWRCLRSEFDEAVERFMDLEMRENEGKRWTSEQDQALRSFLDGKPILARDDWEGRRLLKVSLAFHVGRSEKSAVKRAEALGFRHFYW